jgi:hypothetical protein
MQSDESDGMSVQQLQYDPTKSNVVRSFITVNAAVAMRRSEPRCRLAIKIITTPVTRKWRWSLLPPLTFAVAVLALLRARED